MKTSRLLLLLTAFLLGINAEVLSQPWTYNFGTGTGTHTSNTASTSFLPSPPSGTARVRVGTNPGSIALVNPGVSGLGSGSELQITSNTGSSSTTKFSVHDFAAGNNGYVKFRISFRGGTNGVYNFSLGDGSSFSDNNAMNNTQIFAGLRWSLGASNAITYNVLNNTTYGTTGISNTTTLFTQDTATVYLVEIYANNSNAGIDYERSATAYNLPADSWDLWVDGTRVGTALASGALANNTNFDSYAFNHQVSATTPGTLYLDDIEYSNSLPVSVTPGVVINPGSHDFGNLGVGNSSAGQTFSISGTNLTGAPGNITITAPNTDFEVSTDNIAFSGTINIPYNAATLNSTNFFVRFSPQSGGSKTGNLSFTGGGLASSPAIGISGIATTSSTTSNVIIAAGFSEPENIDYASYQATDISDVNSIEVARFTVQDGGNGLNDADVLATTLTAISFTVSGHANLRRVALYDGSTELGELAAGSTSSFSGLSLAVNDNSSKNLSIRATFAASVTDRAQLSFTVNSVNAQVAGSLFAAADGGAATTSLTGDKNKIQVTATVLAFQQQPSNAGVGSNMSPSVIIRSNDALGNLDTDFSGNIAITSSGTLTGSPVIVASVSGTATFSSLSHSVAGSNLTLTAKRNPENDRDVTSSSFNVVLTPAAGEIVINQLSPDYSGASNEYVELVNKTNKTFDLSLLKLSYQSSSGSSGSAGGNLSGTLAPYSFWLLSPDASITVGQTQALERDGNIAAGFAGSNGQIALQIIGDNTIIDAVGYGTLSGGTFSEGAAVANPPSDGGLKRTADGEDTNANTADFSTVTQANIYLRNSGSRLTQTGATLEAGTYTELIVNGNTNIGGAVTVNRRLTLVNGTLTTLNNLILRSVSSDSTAIVTGGTNASISGQVTVELYLPWLSANNNGYRFVSHPLRNAPPLNTITNLPAGTNTVIGYDEDMNTTQGGYGALNDRTVTLGLGKSIGVWTNAVNTLRFTGELQLDALSTVSLDYAGTSTGWNFMGNPFPGALDWDEVTRSATVNNACYVWIKDNISAGSGSWGTYINGTAANGGSRYLATGQGFVVKATGSSPAPTLGFPLSARVSNQNISYHVSPPNREELRIRVSRWDNGSRYETVVKFDPLATSFFDPALDAEMMSDARPITPDLYTQDASGLRYTINTQPMPGLEHQIMPLQLETFGKGDFSFDFDLTQLRAVERLELEDTKINRFYQVMNNYQHVFQTDSNDAVGRFRLHFNRQQRTDANVSVASQTLSQVNIYSYGSELFVIGLETADAVQLTDLSGRTICEYRNVNLTSGALKPMVASGTYLVRLIAKGGCKTVKVVIQ